MNAIQAWWRQRSARWRESHPPRPYWVCVDPLREIMCESLTAEEYEEHLRVQRQMEENYRRWRCRQVLSPKCV